jgi:predicted TIM-barrel fold metal-dependent hydrolase
MNPAPAFTLAGLLALAVPLLSAAQEKGALLLRDWEPKSQMVTRETRVEKPKFPVIDFHNHLGRTDAAGLRKYLAEMDAAGVKYCISLDGQSRNDTYKQHIRDLQAAGNGRLIAFFAPDFSRIDEPDFGKKEAARLEEAYKLGARGLKIFKSLGLTGRDKSGKLIPVDDPRIDPIWAKCGELGIPVMIHITDPVAFFTPLDKYNERYDELMAHPDWLFYGPQFPSKNEILEQRNRVMARHPKTVFVGAHVANLPEDLGTVSRWLDTYPNLYVDIDARISELGRQPYAARKFFLKYQDRITFGTDTAPNAEAYRIYYRFLETDDEYFSPSGGHHLQGRWNIYGIFLPDEVLKKVYWTNAAKLLKIKS